MCADHSHLTNEDLLLAADGEVSSSHAQRIRMHLAGCAACRARLAEIEKVSADFARTHREAHDSAIPRADGPRALLRARIADAAQPARSGFWQRLRMHAPQLAWASAATLVLAGLTAGMLARHAVVSRMDAPVSVALDFDAAPNRALTPGATRPVSMNEVCSLPHEEVVKEVSASLRTRVLEEYGIQDARAEDYEIDYLIAPGLGGTDDIHNLWPEPYRAGAWDAHVKDALEERLHQLVCAHKIDLVTAQRAIATDWISAYKKYFDTDRPQYVAELPDEAAPEGQPRHNQPGHESAGAPGSRADLAVILALR